MTFRIPESFKVGAITWFVDMVPAETLNGDCGDTDMAKQRIRINEEMTPELKELTFLHELVHVLEVDMDHSYVETLSILLHQVIKQLEITD